MFSVLSICLADPQRFAKTVFIFGDARLTAKDTRAAKEAYQEDQTEEEAAERRRLICVTHDRSEARRLEESAYVLMYWFGADAGLQAYHDVVAVKVGKKKVAFFGRRHWSTVRHRLDLPSGIVLAGYWAADQRRADRIADSDGDERPERFVILRHDEVHDLLEKDCGS